MTAREALMLTEKSVYDSLTEIFSDVLDDDSIVLRRETTAKDVQGWDSMTNVQLMLSAEQIFKVHFSAGQIQSFRNIGDMVDFIIEKSKT
jgi:acyl carrier protein